MALVKLKSVGKLQSTKENHALFCWRKIFERYKFSKELFTLLLKNIFESSREHYTA